jgi:predicted pyridoxine 5'-phosphate oxidase superfamily flavin-nucleotide-binding protein
MERIGGIVLRDYMPEQHREFFPLLPTFFIGGSDDDGRLWASVLWGVPGFVQSPDPTTLRIGARLLPDDPLALMLRPGTRFGGLGLQFETRRRNRANGVVAAVDADGFTFNVLQSFGNCPKYIQTREQLAFVPGTPIMPAVSGGSVMPDAALALIRRCDTFFIASAAETAQGMARGADVSHRGGRPGFAGVDAAGAIVWPDFQGNNFFNTIGNLIADPRAGLLFIDFERGDLLQLSGRAEVVWEGPEVARIEGAKRLLRFIPEHHVFRPGGMPLRWSLRESSPHLDATGTWNDAPGAVRKPSSGS